MIYLNHPHPDKEIKKIVTQNYDDHFFYFILCQFIKMFCLPKEIVNMIFMLIYHKLKINMSHSHTIINTNKSHLFMKMKECRNCLIPQNFFNIVKLGIKYVFVNTEYAITLGLDGMIRYINFFHNEVDRKSV